LPSSISGLVLSKPPVCPIVRQDRRGVTEGDTIWIFMKKVHRSGVDVLAYFQRIFTDPDLLLAVLDIGGVGSFGNFIRIFYSLHIYIFLVCFFSL
jgi:hypothetical protein